MCCYLHELTLPKGDDFRLSVLKYITDGISEGNLEIFVDKIKYYSPEMEEETMTIAEQLRKEGRDQVMKQEICRLERMVLNFRSDGMSVEKISQLMELTPTEITRIIQEITETSGVVN